MINKVKIVMANNTLTKFDKFISGIGSLLNILIIHFTEQERLQREAEKRRAADQKLRQQCNN